MAGLREVGLAEAQFGLEGWGMAEGWIDRAGATRWGKRSFDLVVAVSLLLLALPMIVLAALGSAVSLRAWPFFTQERIGRNGERFRFVKVRTLPVTFNRYIDKHQLDLAKVPAFCQLLRRLHLDELPQLFLVIAGHMSLVGPRPEMPHLHEGMPDDFRSLRTSIRPGCTGLWQVSDSCTDLIGISPEYDRFYVAHQSLRLDLWVLARTLLKMTGFSRPFTLQTIPAWVAPPEVIDLRAGEPALMTSSSSLPTV